MSTNRKVSGSRDAGSLRLRRLTQAYLTPIHLFHSKFERTTVQQVDSVYYIVKKLLLDYQSVTSGLFPRYSKDQQIGYVKDSIYAAFACWACSLAYKRLDDDRGRETELRQSAVKALRGILFCWMQQLDDLNNFKEKNSSEYALHARFDLHTGMILPSPEEKMFGHLQMDLIALYLLTLVELIAGGVQVIYTHDEVCFVQNLVFYIERTYRTPDFGMWERGTRYNNGKIELHASSLGLVKAALEAINGFNLFGALGTSSSVIYVDIDGHNRNRTTFETMLPRESNSKNTDAALLMTIGWPAFATHDLKLYDKAINQCIKFLEGKFGLKRFLRDGYRTELEDASRTYYDMHETRNFQDIECQFPFFFAFLCITALLRGDEETSKEYFAKLEKLLVSDEEGSYLIVPECYVLEEDCINAERANPNSQEFFPVNADLTGHHLWSNAIYIIAVLIKDKLIHASDIDPIYRHLPASQRPKNSNRHSAFQGSMEGYPVVQVALIAESSRLQMMLSTYGINTQTPHELEPVQIWPSWKMVKVFESLGRNEKLGLGGRPPRPFGPLNTSKIFKRFGDTILCYPLLFELRDFYMTADPAVLINEIKFDMEFISKRWKLAGRPTYCMILREENVSGEYFRPMLDLLVAMKNGFVNGIRVRVGRVHQLLISGCTEHVDFLVNNSDDIDYINNFDEFVGDISPIIPKTSTRYIVLEEDTKSIESDFKSKSDHELHAIARIHDINNLRVVAFALGILQNRHGKEFIIEGENIEVHLERVYRQACAWRLWWVVRYCAAKLRKTTNSLAPGITNMLVRGKQITLGFRGYHETTISSPATPDEITNILFNSCPDSDPQAAVLQQELIIACSDLICNQPSAFDGILTIRLSWLSDAISLMLNYIQSTNFSNRSSRSVKRHHPSSPTKALSCFTSGSSVYDLSPTAVKESVAALLTRKNWHLLTPLQSRRLNGSLNRVPITLYDSVWKILERTEGGIVIAGQYLPQQPTLSDMTRYELTFAYKIESMMSVITHPEYRQVLVELLCIIALILERNCEFTFKGKFDMDKLILSAFHRYCDESGIIDRNDMTPFYELDVSDLTTNSTANYLTRAVIEVLLSGVSVTCRKTIPFLANDSLLTLSAGDRNDDSPDSCSIS
ncbi:unnamed protein product [Dracunculus medinensis]|uniref:Phosphorylase b kinase regulatory subunit n=1 Tax=Dracunculus medinensis TaxID=318479 RepID=A0A0N4UDU1_DRAME|nr:unnamed protein product [Dracunculus medinensis]